MNSVRQHQKGASLWMIMLIVAILGFGAIFGLKLIPMYLQWWKVEKAVAGALQSGVGSASKREIITTIVRRLDIDGIYHMTEANLTQFMTIQKKGSRVRVEIDYDQKDALIGNVFLVTHFEKTVTN
jgi:hypothetical protein